MKFYAKIALAAFATLAASGPAYAVDNFLFGNSPSGTQTLVLNGGAFTLQAIDTGWYFQDGFHSPGNNNYIVGDCTSCVNSGSYNDYFVFNLGQITAPITSAVLDIGNGNGYVAGPLSTYSLFDISTPIASLDVSRSNGDVAGQAIFNDLQSGVLFGSRSITSVVQNSQVPTNLNAAAIAALNAARGQTWAIGGTLRSGNVIPGGAVPEPASWGLMILGFGVVGASIRRRIRLMPALLA